jgi:hypothetical protein
MAAYKPKSDPVLIAFLLLAFLVAFTLFVSITALS